MGFGMMDMGMNMTGGADGAAADMRARIAQMAKRTETSQTLMPKMAGSSTPASGDTQ